VTADPRLAKATAAEGAGDPSDLRNVPAAKRDAAVRRLGLLKKCDRFIAEQQKRGTSRTIARRQFAAAHKVPARTLMRWRARWREQGIVGLVDGRGGCRSIGEVISDEAFELFKSAYLDQRRPSVKSCWEIVNYVNNDRQRGWIVPPLAAMYKLTNRIPLYVRVLHREGLAAYEASCAPYVETDPDSVEPGEVWVGDHSQFNLWVRWRGRWIRPWITAWQDMRSRAIVGWHISASPNQTTILLAMKRAVEKYGPPDKVKIDNGKDFDSEMWTGTTKVRRRVLKAGYIDEQMAAGIYAMMGIAISFSIKYHPQSKPVERFFDTLDCQFARTFGTYCGKDTGRRPDELGEYLKSEKALAEACELAEFAGMAGQSIEVYNHTAHSGRGMAGRTPQQVLAGRTSRRALADGALELLMRVWSGELTVRKNGVRFREVYYGQYDMELAALQGRKVRLAYDPDDMGRVWVYDAVTLRLVTIAEQNKLVAYGGAGERDLRDAMRRKREALKIAKAFKDTRLAANMDLPDLAIAARRQRAKAPVAETPKHIRPVRTALDGQVREHKRREAVKAVKKAAGAEGTGTVLDIDFSVLAGKGQGEPLDIDLGSLKAGREDIDLELFGE
jgi:transposase InsO family protein